jgi:hypothetical protein
VATVRDDYSVLWSTDSSQNLEVELPKSVSNPWWLAREELGDIYSVSQSIRQKPAQAIFEIMSTMPKKDFEIHGCRCFVERGFADSGLGAMSPTLASSTASVESCSSLEYRAIAILTFG